MNREVAIYTLKCGIRLLMIAMKLYAVWLPGHLALSISKVYSILTKACVDKHKLFHYTVKRWTVWMKHAVYWQHKFDELKPQASKIEEELEDIMHIHIM